MITTCVLRQAREIEKAKALKAKERQKRDKKKRYTRAGRHEADRRAATAVALVRRAQELKNKVVSEVLAVQKEKGALKRRRD
jgi:hypothetical protein